MTLYVSAFFELPQYVACRIQDEHAELQSGMSDSKSNIVEIPDVAAEDMEVILKFIYGVLDTTLEQQWPSLLLATERLQVIPASPL